MVKIFKLILILADIIGIGVTFFMKSYEFAVYLLLLLLYLLFAFYKRPDNEKFDYFGKRAIISSRIVFFFMLLAIFRLIQVQIVNNDLYTNKIRRQSETFIENVGSRGEIFDNTGKSLAYNTSTYDLAVDPSRIHDRDDVIKAISEILDLKFIKIQNKGDFMSSLEEYYNNNIKYRSIAKNISEEEKEEIDDVLQKYKFNKNEIFMIGSPQRLYYKKDMYSTLVGFVGYTEDSEDARTGIFGVEKEYDQYLKGKKNKRDIRVDRTRKRVIPTSEPELQKVINGRNIYLTIDGDINMVLNEEVRKKFLATKSEVAVGLVMDPNTGRILGVASFDSRKNKALRNSAFQDQFEPGSIFKPIIMAAALNEGLVKRDTKFNIAGGTLARYSHTIKESTKSLKGVISAEDIIRRSSNTGMVLVGDKFSETLFESYLIKYGLYDKTGVDFPGEIKPYTTPSKKWDRLKKSTMSFGQGIAITPIQMITAFSSVINGGVLYRPYLVDRIEDEDGVVIRRNIPTQQRRVLKTETSDLMKEILENAVNNGTGTRAKVEGYRIGGKTGTGQIGNRGRYLKDDYLASFIGFFPANQPKYVILLMFLKPNRGFGISEKYGGSVAAPVFAEIVKRLTKIKSMWSEEKPVVKEIIRSSDIHTYNAGTNDEIKKIDGVMPDLTGMSPKEVILLFDGTGIDVSVAGRGMVTSQIPDKGTDLKGVKKITINLGNRIIPRPETANDSEAEGASKVEINDEKKASENAAINNKPDTGNKQSAAEQAKPKDQPKQPQPAPPKKEEAKPKPKTDPKPKVQPQKPEPKAAQPIDLEPEIQKQDPVIQKNETDKQKSNDNSRVGNSKFRRVEQIM